MAKFQTLKKLTKKQPCNFSKNLTFLFALFFAFSISSQAISSQLPRYLGKEKKFRVFIYNPSEVYRYIGNYNYHAFIEFQSEVKPLSTEVYSIKAPAQGQQSVEAISEVAIGNSDAWLWKISENKNRLYLKPVGDNANTNMTVKTSSGRIYNFELLARTAKSPEDQDLIFAYKFVYPDDSDKNILQFPKAPVSDAPDMRNLSIYNFNYEFTGDPEIAPMKVFDNGEFTYMQFPKKNGELPAIFAVDSEGFESLVNFRIASDYIVVERVGSQFTLRSGNEIVCVYNNNLLKNGKTIYKSPQARENNAKIGNNSLQLPSSNYIQPSKQAPLSYIENPLQQQLQQTTPNFNNMMSQPNYNQLPNQQQYNQTQTQQQFPQQSQPIYGQTPIQPQMQQITPSFNNITSQPYKQLPSQQQNPSPYSQTPILQQLPPTNYGQTPIQQQMQIQQMEQNPSNLMQSNNKIPAL